MRLSITSHTRLRRGGAPTRTGPSAQQSTETPAAHGTVCAMPDSGRSGGSDDGPDYGWLYGGQQSAPGGRAPTGSDDPEPTRMLPTMDRPTTARSGGSAPRQGPAQKSAQQSAQESPGRGQRPTQPAQPVAPPSTPGRTRRKRPVGKILLLVLLAWIVFLVAVPLWAWSKIDKVDAEPSGARPGSQPGTTYLLVGSDSRKGLSKKENRRLGTGGVGDVGQRTDTIMLLHTGSGPSMLLSIPRDSIVAIPGHGTTQDQRRLRVRRPEAAGQDDRAEHRHPHRPLRRDRVRRLRELRRRRRRHHHLPDPADEGPAGPT